MLLLRLLLIPLVGIFIVSTDISYSLFNLKSNNINNMNKFDKNPFFSLPLQSNIFKHFTKRNITLGITFIILSAGIKLFFLGLDLSEYSYSIAGLDLSKYYDFFYDLIALILVLPAYMGPSEGSIGPFVLYMQAPGGNGTGGNSGSGNSLLGQAGPSNAGGNTVTTYNPPAPVAATNTNPNTNLTPSPNSNPTQAGPSNSQQASSYNTNANSQHNVSARPRNDEYWQNVNEVLRLEREYPQLITNTRKGINRTTVTLSQAKKRIIAYKKELGLD